jgi:hypothetical protein
MPRRPVPVQQATLARVLRAIEQTGVRVTVEIAQDGTIRLIPSPNVTDDVAKSDGADREIVL